MCTRGVRIDSLHALEEGAADFLSAQRRLIAGAFAPSRPSSSGNYPIIVLARVDPWIKSERARAAERCVAAGVVFDPVAIGIMPCGVHGASQRLPRTAFRQRANRICTQEIPQQKLTGNDLLQKHGVARRRHPQTTGKLQYAKLKRDVGAQNTSVFVRQPLAIERTQAMIDRPFLEMAAIIKK